MSASCPDKGYHEFLTLLASTLAGLYVLSRIRTDTVGFRLHMLSENYQFASLCVRENKKE